MSVYVLSLQNVYRMCNKSWPIYISYIYVSYTMGQDGIFVLDKYSYLFYLWKQGKGRLESKISSKIEQYNKKLLLWYLRLRIPSPKQADCHRHLIGKLIMLHSTSNPYSRPATVNYGINLDFSLSGRSNVASTCISWFEYFSWRYCSFFVGSQCSCFRWLNL